MGRDKSQGGWLRGLKCPRPGVGLLVGRARDQVLPGLVMGCW